MKLLKEEEQMLRQLIEKYGSERIQEVLSDLKLHKGLPHSYEIVPFYDGSFFLKVTDHERNIHRAQFDSYEAFEAVARTIVHDRDLRRFQILKNVSDAVKYGTPRMFSPVG